MLTERKKKILYAVIQDYLETAEPVGSQRISHRYHLDISPATIRNEMAELEELGYIKQPYTSAGRIPSDKGYRFYVDELMRVRKITHREEDFIKKEYTRIELEPEAILHQTLKILSALLDYVTVIAAPKVRVYLSGLVNMLHQPEFRNIARMEKVLDVLEDEELLTHILSESISPTKKISIKIGSENKHKEFRDCSLVITTCGPQEDFLGIIGPTRMSYNRVVSLMDFISRELNELLKSEVV